MKLNWQKDKVLNMADTRIITYSGTTLCANYRNPLEHCETATQAIRLYKNCISWALQERYPTKEELLAFASKQTLAENGVFVDTLFKGERIDSHVCCVFLGCKGWIHTGLNVDKAIIPMIYLSDESSLKIEVDESIKQSIPVELYYNSCIVGDSSHLSIKDCNKLTERENIDFTEVQLSIEPNLNNVDL